MQIHNKQLTLAQYIEGKIRMLRNDFKVRINKQIIAHFYSLKSEIAVDNYAQTLLKEKFDRM